MSVPKEHQMKCNTCGQIMDLRDLSQVFAHEECNGIPINYDKMEQIEHDQGVKISDSNHTPEFSSPEFMNGYNKLLQFSKN